MPVAKQTLTMLKTTWKEWNDHKAPRIGAALAYYTVFSVAPVLVIAMGIVGLIFGADAAQQHVSAQIEGMVGKVGAQAVEDMLANAHREGGGVVATILGVVTLLLGATTVFVELQGALNTIWDAPPPKAKGIMATLRSRGLSFAMILVMGFLLMVSLVLSAVLSALGDEIGNVIELPPFVLQSVNFIISTAVIWGMFAMLYKFLPDVKITWKDVFVGSLVTAVLFSVGKALIGLYLGHSSMASAYGAAGSFAVMLVWVYYSAQLLLLGAEFTAVYARGHGSRMGEDRAEAGGPERAKEALPPIPSGPPLVPNRAR
jgi:membrane protein